MAGLFIMDSVNYVRTVMMQYTERRAAILKTSKKWLMDILKEKITLPDDCTIHFISDDPVTNHVNMILNSDAFDTVMEGMVPPYLDVNPEWDSEENHGS